MKDQRVNDQRVNGLVNALLGKDHLVNARQTGERANVRQIGGKEEVKAKSPPRDLKENV